jgi:hypothetical protein
VIIIISKNKNECIEKIYESKILTHKSQNILKDIEFGEDVLYEEICNNLDD